jgi:hypothetical protein
MGLELLPTKQQCHHSTPVLPAAATRHLLFTLPFMPSIPTATVVANRLHQPQSALHWWQPKEKQA